VPGSAEPCLAPPVQLTHDLAGVRHCRSQAPFASQQEVWARLDARPPTVLVILEPDHVSDVDLFVTRYGARAREYTVPSRCPGGKDVNEREEVMTGKRQQNGQELRAERPIVMRVLTIVAAVAALAVSAAPASAGLLSSPLGASGATGTRSGGEVVTGFIMKDGNICDPIRHIGC
jgi:hypothetical protein